MPSFEELIYQRLTTDTLMAAELTKFSGLTAVFEIQAPDDKDQGWIKHMQYPRIVYSVDRQENPERKVNGTLVLDIATQGAIEELEKRARDILSYTFFEASDGVVALLWNQSAAFEEEDGVIGVTMTFDLFAFPNQSTTTPDPILGMNTRTKTLWPNAYVFDSSQGTVWTPTVDMPAVYWRISSLRNEQSTNAVAWMNVTLQGHIFAPTPTDRIKLMRAIVENLAINDRVSLSDGSPLLVQNISADSARDPLREGQITITARYGQLRNPVTHGSTNEPLNNINYSLKGEVVHVQS